MRRATIRNRILALSGTLAFLATVVFFDLGCPSTSTSSTDPVASVLVEGGLTVGVGRTTQLKATTYKTGGLEVTGRAITWISVPTTVASVSTAGLVTGVAPGTARITATSEGKSGYADVTVTPAAVATVTVTPPATSLFVLGTVQLAATVKDASGNVLTDRSVAWSGGGAIASVSGSGLVTGQAAGTATITATSEGVPGYAAITVTLAPVATVTVSGAASVAVGATALFTALLKDAAGNVLTRTVTWMSSAATVASVDDFGLVTGVAVGGPVTITATSENKPGSAQITVTAPVTAILTGRVIDYTTQSGIGGATVRFLSTSSGNLLGSTATVAGGTFTSPGLTVTPGDAVYIEAAATGYVTGRVVVLSVPPGVTTNTETIPLVPTASPGAIAGTVKNASTGAGIAAATVDLYNNIQFLSIQTTTTNGSGGFSFSGVPAGTYRLVGSATGFQTATRTGVAVGNGSTTSGQDIVLSATGTNVVRIVLTWGASPRDLDSHLTGPNADATRFHVYYASRGSPTAAPFAGLDVDNTNGFGPETITITQFNSSTGVYRYSVHDYTDKSSNPSSALGASGAIVTVYTPAGPAQTFAVPSGAGTLWTVFEMTGTITNPVITPRNVMSYASDPSTIASPPADGSVTATDAALIDRAVQQHPKVPRRR